MVQKCKTVDVEKTIELLKAQSARDTNNSWKSLRNKLDSLLLSGNTLKSNDTMRLCHTLDNMDYESRKKHILSNWGPQYVNKCEPILKQLECLESKMEK